MINDRFVSIACMTNVPTTMSRRFVQIQLIDPVQPGRQVQEAVSVVVDQGRTRSNLPARRPARPFGGEHDVHAVP